MKRKYKIFLTFIILYFIFKGEIDGLMKQHPHLAHPSQRQQQQQQHQYQQQQQHHHQQQQSHHQQYASSPQQQHAMRSQQHMPPNATASSISSAHYNTPQHQQQRLPTSQQTHHPHHLQQQQHHQQSSSAPAGLHHPQSQHAYGSGQMSSSSAAALNAQLPTPPTAGPMSASVPSASASQGYQKPPPIQRNLTISGGHAMDPTTYNARRHLTTASTNNQYPIQQQRSFGSYEDDLPTKQMLSQHQSTASSAAQQHHSYEYEGKLDRCTKLMSVSVFFHICLSTLYIIVSITHYLYLSLKLYLSLL